MSNIPTNVERFNLITLVLFDSLYNEFPKPLEIQPAKLGASAVPSDASYEDSFSFSTLAEDAVTWLSEEGFIRYGGHDTGGFIDVRLTLKGLALLNYVPSSVQASEPKEPLIKKIRKVLAGGAQKASEEAVKSVIGELLKTALSVGVAVASGGGNAAL